LKYASIPLGIGAYSDAGPLRGNVPPITIEFFVTPGVAAALRVIAGADCRLTATTVETAAVSTTHLFLILPLP